MTKLSGPENMALDRQLFQTLEKGEGTSTVRIYGWKPACISVGYGQDADKLIDVGKAKEFGFDVVKRPTGGGIVFHNEDEVTFSIVGRLDDPDLPQGMIPLYLYFSERVVGALRGVGVRAEISPEPKRSAWFRVSKQNAERRTRNTGLCFSNSTEYEITVNGKKLVGMAQRRGRRAFLIQASILVKKSLDIQSQVLKFSDESQQNAISIEEIDSQINLFDLRACLGGLL